MPLRLQKHGRRSADRRFVNEARANLQKNAALWNDLQEYLEKSESRGCSYSDYWLLYDYITREKPRVILECGTGISTVVLGHAALYNKEQQGISTHITSMEENENWHEMACRLLPPRLKEHVEIICSPKVEDYFSVFRGVRYRDVPERPYEFVFIDGPKPRAPSDNAATFCSDYLRVVQRSSTPVYAITDKRLPTLYVYQQIFGTEKVRYDAARMLGLIGPFTKSDIRDAENLPLPLPSPFNLFPRKNHTFHLSHNQN